MDGSPETQGVGSSLFASAILMRSPFNPILRIKHSRGEPCRARSIPLLKAASSRAVTQTFCPRNRQWGHWSLSLLFPTSAHPSSRAKFQRPRCSCTFTASLSPRSKFQSRSTQSGGPISVTDSYSILSQSWSSGCCPFTIFFYVTRGTRIKRKVSSTSLQERFTGPPSVYVHAALRSIPCT